ncbi:MAG: hypothetical protein KJ621_01650 [Proteobacteria bacterium]|nr:hypothetical protein [Pseudomonadota bacterium]
MEEAVSPPDVDRIMKPPDRVKPAKAIGSLLEEPVSPTTRPKDHLDRQGEKP